MQPSNRILIPASDFAATGTLPTSVIAFNLAIAAPSAKSVWLDVGLRAAPN